MWHQACSQRRVVQARDEMLSFLDLLVCLSCCSNPVNPTTVWCGSLWKLFLVQLWHFCNALHRLKAHPRSLSLLGSRPAQPVGSSSGVASSFLCLCTSLAALSVLPTLGFLCDLLELKHKLEKDKPLGIAQAVLRSTCYGDSFFDVLILLLY